MWKKWGRMSALAAPALRVGGGRREAATARGRGVWEAALAIPSGDDAQDWRGLAAAALRRSTSLAQLNLFPVCLRSVGPSWA